MRLLWSTDLWHDAIHLMLDREQWRELLNTCCGIFAVTSKLATNLMLLSDVALGEQLQDLQAAARDSESQGQFHSGEDPVDARTNP